MNRRDFLRRFLGGLAVAAVAPEVIARACEQAQIPKGTVFSFAPEQVEMMEFTLPPYFECQFDQVWTELMAKDVDARMGLIKPPIPYEKAIWDDEWNALADFVLPRPYDLNLEMAAFHV